MADEQNKNEEQKTAYNSAENRQEPTEVSSFVETEVTEDKLSESEFKKIKKERDEYLAGWQRAKADFLNYQKDERKRLEEFLKFCESGLIGDLLPVLDSFDLALAQFGETSPEGTSDPKFKGFFLIKSQIDEILKKRGLEPIKSVGEKFNPEFHEVIANVEDKNKESQTIVEEIQKGYTLNGRTLRAAKVKIIK